MGEPQRPMTQVDFAKLQPFLESTTSYHTGQADPKAVAKPDVEPVGVQPVPSHIANKDAEEVINSAFSPRKCVLIVSPFMAENPTEAKHMSRYATRCVQDALNRHEAPISTNLFYYDTLNIKVSIDRDIGLQSALSWVHCAELIAVYMDFGVTQAMQLIINTAKMKSKKFEFRSIAAAA